MSDDQSPEQEIEFTDSVVPVRVEITPTAAGIGMQIQADDLDEQDWAGRLSILRSTMGAGSAVVYPAVLSESGP